MKRFRLFLTLLAFLGAGVGVFATAVTAEDAFATSYRIQVSTPCDTIVQDDIVSPPDPPRAKFARVQTRERRSTCLTIKLCLVNRCSGLSSMDESWKGSSCFLS